MKRRRSKRERPWPWENDMKTITFEALSGIKLYIDNVGDCWMVTSNDMNDCFYSFSSLDKAIEFARSLV
jgi:hypothetical protein